jgi:hypothetical protein
MQSNSTITPIKAHGGAQEWGRKARKNESRIKKSSHRRRDIATAKAEARAEA